MPFFSLLTGRSDSEKEPGREELIREVRRETHSITNQAAVTHALVERKARSIQAAEAALSVLHGKAYE